MPAFVLSLKYPVCSGYMLSASSSVSRRRSVTSETVPPEKRVAEDAMQFIDKRAGRLQHAHKYPQAGILSTYFYPLSSRRI